tara:strand:- start:804 stop:1601 length:798 start_codon:yes stop_codon:yes gene_type:complete
MSIYDTVTARILADMKTAQSAGTNWVTGFSVPKNATTQAHYRGINHILLRAGHWATYKQWVSIGAQVKKGEKGTHGIYYARKENAEKQVSMIPCPFVVFSADQVDGYEIPALNEHERSIVPEVLINATGAKIEESLTDRAYYSPSMDYINMPSLAQFPSSDDYYSVLLHELSHWTGHKTRNNRDQSQEKEKYAFEELVAELGSAFLMAHLGLSMPETPRPDHAGYLASWIKALGNDNKFIIQASSQAQKACDYILMSLEQAQKVA